LAVKSSRARACSGRKVSTVSKPFKKPKQAKETPNSLDTDSEGPIQLPPQSDNEGTPDLNPKTTENSEYVPSPASLRTVSETEDEQDNVPLHIAFKFKDTVVGCIPGIRSMSEREADETARHGESLRWSDDSEGDEVPIAQTIRQKTKQSDIWVPTAQTKALLAAAEEKAIEEEALFADVQAIPEGQEAVGVGIARDFGKEVGVFRGEVKHVRAQRKRHVYHVQYEDGDSEDFDLEEYQFAFEARKALDSGKFRRDDNEEENSDRFSNDGTEDEWKDTENVSNSDDNTTLRKKKDNLPSLRLWKKSPRESENAAKPKTLLLKKSACGKPQS
jgi:hypothetical protein